ncbi:MOSC domain-containing protein [Ensifer canadensis]
MRVLAVCVGKPENRPGKAIKTGINKHVTGKSVLIGCEGLEGDAICNRKHHGGMDQAVYIEGNITRVWWEEELGRPIAYGLFGDNLCVEGLDNRTVAAGDRFAVGNLLMEVTAPRMPCRIFAERMGDPSFAKRYVKAARPGFYCRIIKPGRVAAGTIVEYEPFEGERILIAEMMKHYGKKASMDLIERYRSVPVHAKLRASLSLGKIMF